MRVKTMFCNHCGAAVPNTARYCQQCGSATHNARADDAPAAAPQPLSPKSAWVLPVAASMALVWAALVIVLFAVGTGERSWPRWVGAFGNAALLCAYAVILFRRDPRALPLSWTVVALSGLCTLLSGPVSSGLVVMWTGCLAFTLYLGKRPELLVADATDEPRFEPQPEPQAQAREPLLAFPSEGSQASRRRRA
jgi:hypothetical protein